MDFTVIDNDVSPTEGVEIGHANSSFTRPLKRSLPAALMSELITPNAHKLKAALDS